MAWLRAAGLLALIVVVTYLPSLRHGFIWDDDDYVTNNQTLRNVQGLERIWFNPQATPQYYPLTHTSFWIEYHLWGLEPAGYHAINILLHAVAAVLLWRLLVLLELSGAFAAACLFAVHPVNVETVTWITERKNVLSLCFSLAAMLCYLRDGQTRRAYIAALCCFAAAMLSKTVACSVPVVILLLLWWKQGHVKRRDVLRLAPMFAIAMALGAATIWLERVNVGARGQDWSLSPPQRLIIAGRALWFYLSKLTTPLKLTFIYPRWEIDASDPIQWIFPLTVTALLGGLWLARKRIGRGPIVAAMLYTAILFPALGFADVYPMRFSFVADHFQYAAGIVILASVAALAATHLPARQFSLAACLAVALLAGLTGQRQQAYRDLPTLWRDTLAKNPDCWMAETNLAACELKSNELEDAEYHARRALELRTDVPELHNTLGAVLAQQARYAEAGEQFAQAARLNPNLIPVQINWGTMLARSGDIPGAIIHFQKALGLDPSNQDALRNLAIVEAAEPSDTRP